MTASIRWKVAVNEKNNSILSIKTVIYHTFNPVDCQSRDISVSFHSRNGNDVGIFRAVGFDSVNGEFVHEAGMLRRPDCKVRPVNESTRPVKVKVCNTTCDTKRQQSSQTTAYVFCTIMASTTAQKHYQRDTYYLTSFKNRVLLQGRQGFFDTPCILATYRLSKDQKFTIKFVKTTEIDQTVFGNMHHSLCIRISHFVSSYYELLQCHYHRIHF